VAGSTAAGEKFGSGILLLDGVSSSVDRDTDRLMQRIIQEEFDGYILSWSAIGWMLSWI